MKRIKLLHPFVNHSYYFYFYFNRRLSILPSFKKTADAYGWSGGKFYHNVLSWLCVDVTWTSTE